MSEIINRTSNSIRILIAILFLFNSSILYSQTYIEEGTVSGTWSTSGSPYIINGDITIESGQSLKINAGVEIIFQGHFMFTVNGSLNANGTESNNVLFTSSADSVYWFGIRFMEDNETESSSLHYCIIEKNNGNDGSNSGNGNANSGGILISHYSNLLVENCTIQNNIAAITAGVAVYACAPVIRNTKIIHNHASRVISVYDGKGAIFVGCLIANNHGGIKMHSHMFATEFNEIINSTIVYNNRGGEYMYEFSKEQRITNTIFFYNSPSKIRVFSGSYAPEFTNCLIEGGEFSIIKNENGFYYYTNNLELPPAFYDPENEDYSLFKSPCNNSGKTVYVSGYSKDLANNPRIRENQIDIGAYEYQLSTLNRRPFIRHIPVVYAFKNDSRLIDYFYFDVDEEDSHQVELSSSSDKIIPELIELTAEHIKVRLNVLDQAPDSAYIYVKIEDDDGTANNRDYTDTTLIYTDRFAGYIDDCVQFQDTIKIIGDVTVRDSGCLKILPGAYIEFQDSYKMDIYGSFKAVGTQDSLIEFNAKDTASYYHGDYYMEDGWLGLNFYNVNSGTEIQYCNFFNSGKGDDLFYGPKTTCVYLENSSDINIDHCHFNSNYSSNRITGESLTNSGVAINNSENIHISNCKFGQGTNNGQGGIYILTDDSKAKVSNCRISSAKFCSVVVDFYGGENESEYVFENNIIENIDANILCYIRDNVLIQQNQLINNDAIPIISYGDNKIFNNIIASNRSHGRGAIHMRGDYSLVIGNLLYENRLDCDCGNFYAGGILAEYDDGIIANNTITENYNDSYGSTIYISYAAPTVFNNIIYNNQTNGISYYNGSYGAPPPVIFNNMITNPSFVSPNDKNFMLNNESAAIDAGIIIDSLLALFPERDINGNKRVDSLTGQIDLGAFNYVNPNETNELNYNKELFFYPNPTNDYVYLKSNIQAPINFTLIISDLSGKVIDIQYNLQSNEPISVLGLSNGIYTFAVFTENGFVSEKISIIRN